MHTKGPWHAERADLSGGDDPNRWAVLNGPVGGPNFFIATIENGALEDTLKTEEANARLIAQAPAMYDLITALVHVSEHGPFDPSPLDEHSPLMDEARTILRAITP